MDAVNASSPAASVMSNKSSSTNVLLTNGTADLGVGFSGSGFLILYFTGVVAVLQKLGIVTNSTRLAGASGGSAVSAMSCAGVPGRTQYQAALPLAQRCRAASNCEGYLDRGFNATLSAVVPSTAARDCSGRLWVSVTVARPGNETDINKLLGGNWSSRGEVISAVRLSSFIPSFSAPAATLQLPELEPAVGPAGYDGGFTLNLPCPPGVGYCIKVASSPPNPSTSGAAGASRAVQQFNERASALVATSQGALLAASPATAPYLPLNPVPLPTPAPDIYPGLSGPLPVNSTVWGSWSLNVPDDSSLAAMYAQGAKDAAAWAVQQGLASADEAAAAVNATALAAARR